MKKKFALLTVAFLLAACGDEKSDVTNVYQTGLEVASSVDDLPECTKDNEGEQAVVKGETVLRVCLDGDWVAMNGAGETDFSCKTVELKDKSGLKIVCNGDSIGVVLNGSDGKQGEDGKAGAGCSMKDKTDSTITVVCGDSTMVIEIGNESKSDTLEADSERVAISLDSIVGLTQKGPFLKGSTVYLYELSDGRTLKQTNGNFTSNISQENGRYKFLARDLVSQYAMIIVDGYYRNEVTGEPSEAPIRLKAITDMRKRSSVNVNILTHLEFERVYYLVTRDKYTVKQAKRKAQQEIMKFFGIELGKETDAEDMDVFGSSDADAALLAISILLQGSRTESDMMALLSELSSAMAEDSVWDDDRAKAIKAEMADWAFGQQLSKFRKNVEGWGLSDAVGNFEKYIDNFIVQTLGISACGDKPDEIKRPVLNKKSRFYGHSYECFLRTLVWDKWDSPRWIEIRRDNPYLNPNLELDPDYEYSYMIDWRDRRMYPIIGFEAEVDDNVYYEWMAVNLDFDYKVNGEPYGTACFKNDCFSDSSLAFGRYYTWGAAMDSAGVFSTDALGCGLRNDCNAKYHVQGLCPEGWYLPNQEDWEHLITFLKQTYTETPGEILRAKEGWLTHPNKKVSSLDTYGFSAAPAGFHNPKTTSPFVNYGYYAYIWTSSTSAVLGRDDMAKHIMITGANNADNASVVEDRGKDEYLSVRCMRH